MDYDLRQICGMAGNKVGKREGGAFGFISIDFFDEVCYNGRMGELSAKIDSNLKYTKNAAREKGDKR